MTLNEAMARLEALGDPAVLRVAYRDGAPQFGVKLGDIRKLAKAIKRDDALALQLWDTGNSDARLLAILLLRPQTLTIDDLDRMVRSNVVLQVSDWLNSYLVKAHPEKEALRLRLMEDDHAMAARAGWSLTAERIEKAPEGLDLTGLLDRIERDMPAAPPEAQWTMNVALANLGINHPALRDRALAIGEKIGLYRDYPTPRGCTSPFAPLWINEMVRRAG